MTAKKPTALRVIEGNPGHRALPKNEPKPRAIRPPCPRWLPAAGRREWRRLAPELERLGLLTVVDGAAFAGYCQAIARMMEIEAIIATEGLTVPGRRGEPVKHPLLPALAEAQRQILAGAREFGLTPASRSRISLPPSGDDDPWAEFMR